MLLAVSHFQGIYVKRLAVSVYEEISDGFLGYMPGILARYTVVL